MSTICFLIPRVPALLLALYLPLADAAQESETPRPSAAGFSYRFENARFYVPLMEIDLAPDGVGELRFKRGTTDEIIDLKLKMLPETMSRIRGLYDGISFLDSTEEYQGKKDFSHLGWMTIRASDGRRERKVRFNNTANKQMKELADLFRSIATQQMHLFDLETAQQYQPLDVPRQLDAIEADLRLGNIAELEQIALALREIAAGDTLPLIARNQANRMIADIQKGKYKLSSK
ncbi:MAG TPA: hypothetical protein VGV87_04790 [Blastocatellia bacterium]|jgi:hypothetical protein|nr:hypothetical protein [Blastocatellia bacterium]